MDDNQDLKLDDIISEFSGDGDPQETDEGLEEEVAQWKAEVFGEEPPQAEEETPEEAVEEEKPSVTSDTIRMDTIRLDTIRATKGEVRNAQPIVDEEPQQEPFSDQWEPEYDEPMGEYVTIVKHPRSRLRELKKKLVAGPEKRYYALSEKGLGKLQAAIFLSLLVVLISGLSTVMYAMGFVQENRMRLMVFGQLLAMLVSALLGSYQLIEGVADLFRKRFSLNTMLVLTFIVCCVDGVFCLQQLRVPCCAAFSLEMTMSLWSAYQRRNTELGQMDTMRKATHLDAVVACPDYLEGKKGFLRTEGQVEDFMDHYNALPQPEKMQDRYAMIAAAVSLAVGITAGVLHDVYAAFQVFAVTLLAAVPVASFVAVSRPFGVLERRLHAIGTVLCGWQGVEEMSGKALFPVTYNDLFPAGTTRMNGVKFFGSREPDEIVAYCTALIKAENGGLKDLFVQVLESRNGSHYNVEEFTEYNGGIGGVVEGEAVLVGSLSFLKGMEVEVPEGVRVSQAVCIAIDGELCGLFALNLERFQPAAAGLATLCGHRGLQPVLTSGDFLLTPGFVHSKLKVNARKMQFPEQEIREELAGKQVPEDARSLALITGEGLMPFAYAVTGARALRSSARLGVIIGIIGGALGIAMMLALTVLGTLQYLTPANMFLYQLVWLIPGLLITEWTRNI